MGDRWEELAFASFDRRGEAWSRWGVLDADVLAPLANPVFSGGPRWPGLREAFRVARAPDAVLVASDGLSDPYDPGEGPEDVNGIGLECFAFTPDRLNGLPGSWLFNVVWQVSQLAAGRGDVADLLAEYGLITTEIAGIPIPDAHRATFVNDQGRVGVLIGLPAPPIPPYVSGALSPIRLAAVTLLTAPELAFVTERYEEGRQLLAERLPSAASSLLRASVVHT